ncbi:hypothetical protein [Phreatobacter sp.]|uniref:hypothetical protein n=1 Tax=Phreatobacter sp. TaxID=1966341 RepID=UPI003F72BD6E
MTLSEAALGIVGALHLLMGWAAARRVRMDGLLDAAISALSLKPVPAAERRDARWRMSLAVAVFSGGALTLVQSLAALPVLVATLAGQAWYVGRVASRVADPDDPPEPGEAGSDWMIVALQGAVTALVAAAAHAGILHAPGQQPLALAGALAAGLAFGIWQFRSLSLPVPGLSGGQASAPADPPEPLPETVRLMVRPFVLPVADDRTGRVVPNATIVEAFGETLSVDIRDWEDDYFDTIPPRKREGGFADPADAARFAAEGAALVARMNAALGQPRVVYAPPGTVFPMAPERLRSQARRIKVMADYACHPLWSLDDDDPGQIAPDTLGVSPELVAGLDAWARAFEDALDWDNPGGPGLWSDAEAETHRIEGRRLAAALARELRARGRTDVEVSLATETGAPVVVSPDDEV